VPIKSKVSSENPIGSMILWQAAHTGFFRCSSIRCRTEVTWGPALILLKRRTSGGGRGAGVQDVSKIHFARETGEVRLATEVTGENSTGQAAAASLVC